MKIRNIFSRRNKQLPNEIQLNFMTFPEKLRIQILHIVNDFFETIQDSYVRSNVFKDVIKVINHEYGSSIQEERHLIREFMASGDILFLIDFVELIFGEIEELFVVHKKVSPKDSQEAQVGTKLMAMFAAIPNEAIKDAIEELNTRLKDNNVGYRYEAGQVIKFESEYAHTQVTVPAIKLLQNAAYAGANDEFMRAHDHHMHGRNQECITECLKAFESTMKCICEKRKWKYDKDRDTSQKLIAICFKHRLFPEYLQIQLGSLRSLLESGVGTIRNKLGGHGQGKNIRTVDDNIANYALSLCAANIVFMINAEASL